MDSVFEEALQSAQDMQARLQAKALADPDFRGQLVRDPRATIRSELGMEVPDGVEIQVHEASLSTLHVVVPSDLNDELDEEQLEGISAGTFCCLCL